MEKHWDMSPASVLISITGGAQDLQQAQARPLSPALAAPELGPCASSGFA